MIEGTSKRAGSIFNPQARIKELEEEVRELRKQNARLRGVVDAAETPILSKSQSAIAIDEAMPESVKRWLSQDFDRQASTGLSLRSSTELWAVKYSNGEMHRYTVEQMADKFGLTGELAEGMPVKHKKNGNEGVVLARVSVVAVKYSNGEIHRYTAEQMAEKFGLKGQVTEGMAVKHKKNGNEGYFFFPPSTRTLS